MNTIIRQFLIAQLKIDAEFQIRAALNHATITEYAEAMKAGEKFPPIKVVNHNGTYLLADGFHRLKAAQQNGKDEILAEFIEGDESTALEIAIKANSQHGLRFTTADKRRATASALRQWPEKSDRLIAQMVGVSAPTVGKARSELKNISSSPVRVGADGKTRHVPSVPPRPDKHKPSDVPLRPAPTKVAVRQQDKTGLEIPSEIVKSWNQTTEDVREIRHYLKAALAMFERIEETKNIGFIETEVESNIAKLKYILADIKQAIPFAVCPTCSGVNLKDCPTCKERGFVSEHFWKHGVSEFHKKIRALKK